MSSSGTPPVGLTPSDVSSGGMFSTDRIGGFGYGVGVSVGILLLITTITLASYFCTRAPVDAAAGEAAPSSRRHRGGRGGAAGGEAAHDDVELGIDEATLKGYPEVVYGEARKEANKAVAKKGTTCTCCSICPNSTRSASTRGSATTRRVPRAECRRCRAPCPRHSPRSRRWQWPGCRRDNRHGPASFPLLLLLKILCFSCPYCCTTTRKCNVVELPDWNGRKCSGY